MYKLWLTNHYHGFLRHTRLNACITYSGNPKPQIIPALSTTSSPQRHRFRQTLQSILQITVHLQLIHQRKITYNRILIKSKERFSRKEYTKYSLTEFRQIHEPKQSEISHVREKSWRYLWSIILAYPGCRRSRMCTIMEHHPASCRKIILPPSTDPSGTTFATMLHSTAFPSSPSIPVVPDDTAQADLPVWSPVQVFWKEKSLHSAGGNCRQDARCCVRKEKKVIRHSGRQREW